jgi:hypothetical protein
MRTIRLLSLLPLLALCAGCWNPRYFAPREHVAASGPDGSAAALYTVPAGTANAPAAGELRVWSRGARARFTDDDREIVELHVGFELENNGAEPLQLDPGTIVCEDLMVDGLLQPPLAPVRIDGDGAASPGATARVDLTFEAPTNKPRDVDSFAVRFQVRSGEHTLLQQVTPFGVAVRRVDDRDYWGPGWGWGLGFGLGWHGHHWHHH